MTISTKKNSRSNSKTQIIRGSIGDKLKTFKEDLEELFPSKIKGKEQLKEKKVMKEFEGDRIENLDIQMKKMS